jgi:TolB protein
MLTRTRHGHLLVAAAVTLAMLAAAASATATVPGSNGQIAFRRYLDAAHTTSAIFVINPDGTGERQLTNPGPGTIDNQPDWSPDGSKIAFERCTNRCEVWEINADGSGLARLGPDCDATPPPTCEDRSAAVWSPDGRSISISRAWGAVRQGTIRYSALSIMNAQGGGVRQLVVSKPFAGDRGSAAWSPDGKRLVVEIVNDGLASAPAVGPQGHRALFIVNADGKGLRQLTPWSLNGGEHPDWSPDGKRILFRSVPHDNDELNGGVMYTIRPDGSGLEALLHVGAKAFLNNYSYSPDGKWITFAMTGLGGQPDIFIMHTDGSGITPVTRTTAWDSGPDWGPAAH